MRRLASLVGRLLVSLAATVFLLGALMMLLGLHLTLMPLRGQRWARLQLGLEIAERAAQIVLLARDADELADELEREHEPIP